MKTIFFLAIFSTLPAAALPPAALHPALKKTEFGGNTAPISIEELRSITTAKALHAKELRVTFTIEDSAIDKPITVTAKIGQEAVAEVVREFRYPTEFDAPVATPNANTLTPTTPNTFEVQLTGPSLRFVASLKGPLVAISGKYDHRTFEGFIQNAGSVFRPVAGKDGKLLSVNRMALR